MEKLFLLAREMSDPKVWSAGVELARNAFFQEESLHTPGDRAFRLLRGQRDPVVLVSLSEANEIWQCDCSLDEDPCRHVIATILAVKQGKLVQRESSESRKVLGGVRHEFSRNGSALRFDRFLLHRDSLTAETRIPVPGSLLQAVTTANRDGYLAVPTDAELKIDYVLPQSKQGVLDPKTMRFLLSALSRVSVVTLDGEQISVNPEPLPVVVEVIDEAGGFRIRRACIDGITEIFDNGVAICNGALQAIEDSALRMEEVEMLRADGTFFPESAAIELATRIIPQIQGKVRVQIASKLLPRVRRIPPRVVIEAISDELRAGVTITPRIMYGDPVIAEVNSGALKLFDPREIPIREVAEEARLARVLALKTGLRLDYPSTFKGEAALERLNQLKEWRVVGDDLSSFTSKGELTARAQVIGESLLFTFHVADTGEIGDGDSGHSVLATDMLLAWRQGSSYLQLAGGAGWAKLPTEWLREHGAALERFIAAVGEKEFAPGRLISEVGELCDSLRIEPPEYFKRLKSGLAEVESIPDAELPRDLRADLRKYQRTGINWISFLHRHGLGALLADDMGLGKTLQALCVVSGRTLVVCPTSVLASWRQQIELFRPSLNVSVYHGSRRELAQDVDVILTSYALLRLDIDRLIETEWDLVVLDEAQTIRNPSSQVAQAAYRLRAKKRLSLSGTPVENSLDDLWSHFRFLNPGLLGDYQQFQQRFVQPIELGQVGPTQELRKRSMPFIMRRLKRDVASELPPKTEVVLECELSDRERIVYESVLGMIKDDVLEALDSNRGVFSVLEVLLRLRQACCHIGLLPGHQADSSSKIDLLIESLQGSKAHGHRALVFSQWTTLLDRIEPHLERHSISFCRIDGSTADRGDLVNSFQSPDGPDVMLLSLKAGGLGVTLTAADHVYIVDPWWNPAAEDQAADRAYRIGQNNPVFVHRLVAKDTIEERIIQIQQEKRALLAAAIGESGSLALSREDVLRILAV